MKCQMHWQHPSSIYIIWFGPSCRLGEHETQRDILERALGIMEAEFGGQQSQGALHGAAWCIRRICLHHWVFGWVSVYDCVCMCMARDKGEGIMMVMTYYDQLWLLMTYDSLWLVMTRYCWFCSFNLLILLILRYDVVEATVLSGDSPGVRQPGEPEPCLRRFGGRQGTGASSFFVRFSPLEYPWNGWLVHWTCNVQCSKRQNVAVFWDWTFDPYHPNILWYIVYY